MAGPLEGVRVVEFTGIGPGPVAPGCVGAGPPTLRHPRTTTKKRGKPTAAS
jgi:hypothetical protein